MAGAAWAALWTFHWWRVAGAGGGRIFRHGRSVERGKAGRDCAGQSPADVDAAVQRGAGGVCEMAGAYSACRARYLYALARLVQKHSRLLAVLETMDNGKPIRESRDIDIPLVARHFYYHAGWAQLLEQRISRTTNRAAWSDRSFPGIFRC